MKELDRRAKHSHEPSRFRRNREHRIVVRKRSTAKRSALIQISADSENLRSEEWILGKNRLEIRDGCRILQNDVCIIVRESESLLRFVNG